jgi:CubicO group peptidase (beta-lactamase class C family)
VSAEPRSPTHRPVWSVLDGQVKRRRFPGYAAAVISRGAVEVRVAGSTAFDAAEPVRAQTLFRLASLTKAVGAALALELAADGAIGLHEPVATWLPELAAPRVLTAPDAALTDTEPAGRPILVGDLLRFTCGFGLLLVDGPLSRSYEEQGLLPGAQSPSVSGADFVARLADLPLACQPGTHWLYHSGMDVLSVLLARATSEPLGVLLRRRITGPLGMHDTDFQAVEPDRLASSYAPTEFGLRLVEGTDGPAARPPTFATLGGGLVSTVGDYLRFLDEVGNADPRVLSVDTVRSIRTESLTVAQRAGVIELMGTGSSWGMGVGVDVGGDPARPWLRPGRFGWNGGSGTTAYVDPSRQRSAVLLTQRQMASPTGDFDAFWAALDAEGAA